MMLQAAQARSLPSSVECAAECVAQCFLRTFVEGGACIGCVDGVDGDDDDDDDDDEAILKSYGIPIGAQQFSVGKKTFPWS